ncbi:MAG: hypothetical protein HC902_14190 [Calothrix sp. SM1_5_4]|nr:hypothetical protein [Calothrix sp. SM1_5_4]
MYPAPVPGGFPLAGGGVLGGNPISMPMPVLGQNGYGYGYTNNIGFGSGPAYGAIGGVAPPVLPYPYANPNPSWAVNPLGSSYNLTPPPYLVNNPYVGR